MEWKKVNEKLIKDGYRKVSLKTFILPDGRQMDFEIKKEGEAVCILPITKDNKVVLARQFRPGPEKMFLELPGGGLSGDTPLEAAKRELLEETGYAGELRFVSSIPDCGYSSRIRHVFVATDCEKIGKQSPDDTEFIEVVEMPLEDFRNHLRTGQLTDIESGYLGLDFLDLL